MFTDPLPRRKGAGIRFDITSTNYSNPEAEITSAFRTSKTSTAARTFVPRLFILTALALFSRLYLVGRSPYVVWDEAYFGTYVSYYLKRQFFFSLHPPLGTMLLALSALATNYDGSFHFRAGSRYHPGVEYTLMRSFSAVIGAACVPVAYCTAKEMNLGQPAVWLMALMVLCESSFALLSRFILLDSMLLFFTATTLFCLAKMRNARQDVLSSKWLLWSFLTGVSLGCAVSVKWAGIFSALTTWIYALGEMWHRWRHARTGAKQLSHELLARLFSLLIVPTAMYVVFFYVHLGVLQNSGPGDDVMSSVFQAKLGGTRIAQMCPVEVAFGSIVTVKNTAYGGGLLHSASATYPGSSRYHQVTTVLNKNPGNTWRMSGSTVNTLNMDHNSVKLLSSGDKVKMVHVMTRRNLYSRLVAAPLTQTHYEVSTVDGRNDSDENDLWIIELIPAINGQRNSHNPTLQTVQSPFRLKHAVLGCYLRSATVVLPFWGGRQLETTCVPNEQTQDKYSLWNVEEHWNSKLPRQDLAVPQTSFFHDFIGVHGAMIRASLALASSPDRGGPLTSRFWQWPFLQTGLRLTRWDDATVKYFLLGNPFNYWVTAIGVCLIVLSLMQHMVSRFWAGAASRYEESDKCRFSEICYSMGWVLHFAPYAFMDRPLYVHHYHPALYFAMLATASFLDRATRSSSSMFRSLLFTILFGGVTGTFGLFSAHVYGMKGNARHWNHLQWLDTWTISQ